jgi:hypothetical protein
MVTRHGTGIKTKQDENYLPYEHGSQEESTWCAREVSLTIWVALEV